MRVPYFNKEGYADPTAQAALKRCPVKNKKIPDPTYRPIVFICSPYAGDTERNVKNAIRYCKYALSQNKFPFAPHLLFPQFLDDRIPEERELGLKYGRIYLRECKEVWVFGTYFSRGMEAEITLAKRWKIPVQFFTLNILRELKQKGVDVFFERENIHSNSGDGELMLTILSSFAQEESRSVSENCKWRLREKMKQGELVGLRDMYGYLIERDCISIEPRQADIVRQIFSWYVTGDSSVVIARRLNTAGELTLKHAAWSARHVREILTNEKYAGNALLQKSYITDHLSKRKKRNNGEVPRYFVEQSHPAIVNIDTFEAAQALLEMAYKNNQPQKPVNARYPFTGRIICGNCGKKFQRKTTNGHISWHCATYLEHGKSACPAKQIPEAVLFVACAEVLGLSSFDETEFTKRITWIEVHESNTLRFIFTDGKTHIVVWKDRSRSESWTDEMKQAAREKSLAIKEILYGGSDSKTGN